jgi:hypothetical protein
VFSSPPFYKNTWIEIKMYLKLKIGLYKENNSFYAICVANERSSAQDEINVRENRRVNQE